MGTSTVGSGTKPIYWNAGVPAASSSTVGGASTPVYLSSGTITAGNALYTEISSSVDLNDYRTTGTWCFSSAPTNIPSGSNGWLYVSGQGSLTHVKQFWGRWGTNDSNNWETYVRNYNESTSNWSSWYRFVCSSGTSAVGSANKPCYVASSGLSTVCNEFMPITGSTFTGLAYAQTNTSYTTYQLRNIALTTSTPSSLTNGYVCMVYS